MANEPGKTKFRIRYLSSKGRWSLTVGRKRFVMGALALSAPVQTEKGGVLAGQAFITIWPKER